LGKKERKDQDGDFPS